MNKIIYTLGNFESSNITSIEYDGTTKDLIVGFKNKSKYRYPNFPFQTFLDFSNSESKGKFFFKNIKNLKNEKIKEDKE